MTLAEIEARLRAIDKERNSPETAHDMEDALHRDVLRAIADDDLDCSPSLAATYALFTTQINFARWYA